MCGALVGALALAAMLAPLSSAATNIPTEASVKCTEVNQIGPPAFNCTATVKGLGNSNNIGHDAFEDLHSRERVGAMIVEFFSTNTGTFAHGNTCYPAEELSLISETFQDHTQCSVGYVPFGFGSAEIIALFSSERVNGTFYERSTGTTQIDNPPAETTVTVSCSPATVVVGQASVCASSVADGATDPRSPNGTVMLKTSERVEFGAPSCTLVSVQARLSSCAVTATPLAVGSGSPLLQATYSGEPGSFLTSATQVAGLSVEPPHATETALKCAPATVSIAQASSCTATVIDKSTTNQLAPSGTVNFSSGAPGIGAFSGAGHCTLAAAGAEKATCQVSYTPSAVGSGVHRLTAIYQPDVSHRASQGATQLPIVQSSPPAPAAPAPNTTLQKKPRKKSPSGKATFKFVSDQADAGFQCKLDKGPFKPCRSPFTKKVSPGRHVFEVQAVNAQGAVDATPAVFRWSRSKK